MKPDLSDPNIHPLCMRQWPATSLVAVRSDSDGYRKEVAGEETAPNLVHTNFVSFARKKIKQFVFAR